MARMVVMGIGTFPSFAQACDLRFMLENASGYHENHEPGRWGIETEHAQRAWEVIVEPLWDEQVLVVVTAYPVY
jgi:hypothetical protein